MADWTPAEIATELWLDAADESTITEGTGGVEQWDDKSGNARHATQTGDSFKPDYDAVNKWVSFTPDERMSLDSQPVSGTSQRLAIAVVQTDSLGVAGSGFFAATDSSVGTGSLWDLCHETDGFWVRISGNDYFTPNPAEGSPFVASIQFVSGSSNTQRVFNTGDELARAGGSSQLIGTSTGTAWLGYTEFQASTQFAGKIMELIIVTETVNERTRQLLEGYIAWKWGLQGDLPAGHPYESAAPLVESLWTPAYATTELWLDESSVAHSNGLVTDWFDKSGNDYSLTQGTPSNQPVYNPDELNGLNTLFMDGVTDRLLKSANTNLGRNTDKILVMGIIRVDAFDNGWAFNFSTSAGGNTLRFLLRPATGNLWEILTRPDTSGSTTAASYDGTADIGQWRLFTGLADYATGELIIRLSGLEVANNPLAVTTTQDTESEGLGIGISTSGASFQQAGHAEWIVAHDDVYMEKLEGYLAWKWGLQGDLPVDHPYKDAAPQQDPVDPPQTDWTPADTITQLWLDAADASTITESGGDVSQWNDKSGNGYTFSGATGLPSISAETLGGIPVMQFSGAEQLVADQVPLDFDWMRGATPYTMIAVMRFGSSADPNSYMVALSTGGGTQSIAGIDLQYDDRSGIFSEAIRFLDSSGTNDSGVPIDIAAPDVIPPNTPSIVGLDIDPSDATLNNRVAWRENGGPIFYGTNIKSGNLSGTSAYTLTLGALANGGGFNLDGFIAEVVALPALAVGSEREKIEGYLAWKWGLEADLPLDHPYKDAAPQQDPSVFPPTVTGPNDFDAIESSEAGFAVSAMGGAAPYTYQWYDSIVGLRVGDTIDQIIFTADLSQDGATFWCVVTGDDGEFTESRHATLTVAAYTGEPAITVQPEDATREERYSASFTVVASDPSGTGLTYQWAEIIIGDIAAATTSVLTFAEVERDDSGRQFYCKVTNEHGTTNTNVVTLTVTANTNVIYPGDLGKASYPSFFACATWEYGQAITGNLARTSFDSGWVRQRKQWRENNSSVRLTFQMNTAEYEPWNRWMVNNGYDWFTMYLDRFYGEKALYEVRLVSAMSYTYKAFDVIVVTVLGELGASYLPGQPDSGLSPPNYGPGEGPITTPKNFPECSPYDCASLDDYFKSQVDTSTILLEGDSSGMPYPFATTRPESYGHPSLFSAWIQFVAAPQQFTTWNGSYPELHSMTGYSWYEDASKYVQCGLNQETLYGVALQGSDLQMAITPPTSILHSTRTGSSTTAIVSGQNGGTRLGINFQNNGAGNWYVTTRVYGSNKYNYVKCPVSSSIGMNSEGTFSLSFACGSNAGAVSKTITLETGNPYQWFMITIGEGSEFIVHNVDPYDYEIRGVVSASITAQDGSSVSGSVSGYRRSTTSVGAYIDHENRGPRTFYEAPYFMYAGTNRRCNLLYLSHGAEVDPEESHLKFFQNLTNYTPPPYCE